MFCLATRFERPFCPAIRWERPANMYIANISSEVATFHPSRRNADSGHVAKACPGRRSRLLNGVSVHTHDSVSALLSHQPRGELRRQQQPSGKKALLADCRPLPSPRPLFRCAPSGEGVVTALSVSLSVLATLCAYPSCAFRCCGIEGVTSRDLAF